MSEQTITTTRQSTPPPNNIPVQLTALIGRERDVQSVRQLLSRSEVRLLTLTGPGGVGKTRLASQVARYLLWDYEGGVYFVNLAPLTDSGRVLATIADTLDIKEGGDMPLHVELNDRLGGERTLLVLDNLEQLLDAATSLVDLLHECPHLKLLVTSRVPLHVGGKFEYQVPPLALPAKGQPADLASASQSPAVSLFVKRASAIQYGFDLTPENAATVADICARLDGLPLALELAAAHIKTLPPSSMLKRLVKRLPLLVGGARDLPMRHRTLRGTMDWSYGLLTTHERETFRALSIFVGGFTFEAASDTAGKSDLAFIETMRALVDASLLQQTGDKESEAEPRYTMLETVREYGLEQLEAQGETSQAHDNHAQYFLAMSERAEPMLTGSEQATWLERLDADHDNLRAALSWLIESANGEAALRLAGSLWRFWYMRGFLSEGRRWLSSVPLTNPSMPAPARAMALNGSGVLAYAQGDINAARE